VSAAVGAPPFATAEDYLARYGDEASADPGRLAALLDDASALIAAECPGIDRADPVAAANARAVACAVVRRAVGRADGVASVQQAAGPYSGQVTWANPEGAMYLTKQDRARLGCEAGCVLTVGMG